LAFPEDDESYGQPRPQYAAPLMNFSSVALLALILQIGAGIIALNYTAPGIVLYITLSSAIAWESYELAFISVWSCLLVVGIIQIYFGYRLYKKTPGIFSRVFTINILAVALYGVDIVISFFNNLLFPYPDVIVYFGVNILLVILLNMSSIRDQLAPEISSFHTDYY